MELSLGTVFINYMFNFQTHSEAMTSLVNSKGPFISSFVSQPFGDIFPLHFPLVVGHKNSNFSSLIKQLAFIAISLRCASFLLLNF
jgi:hypothetical protein